MPRPNIDPYWRERVFSLKANNPTWGPGRIRRALEREPATIQRDDWPPAERTIGRLLVEFEKLGAARLDYEEFYWPDSMERGDVPWEAGAAAIEMLAELDHDGLGELRPSIREVRWFWRVSLAAPALSRGARINIAFLLAARSAAQHRPSGGTKGIFFSDGRTDGPHYLDFDTRWIETLLAQRRAIGDRDGSSVRWLGELVQPGLRFNDSSEPVVEGTSEEYAQWQSTQTEKEASTDDSATGDGAQPSRSKGRAGSRTTGKRAAKSPRSSRSR